MAETRKKAPSRAAKPRRAAGKSAARGAAAVGASAASGASAARGASAKRDASRPAPAKPSAAGTLTVVQFRSAIACTQRQRGILRSLGLRGPSDRRQLPDHASVRGMVAALPHLVRIDEGGPARRSRP